MIEPEVMEQRIKELEKRLVDQAGTICTMARWNEEDCCDTRLAFLLMFLLMFLIVFTIYLVVVLGGWLFGAWTTPEDCFRDCRVMSLLEVIKSQFDNWGKFFSTLFSHIRNLKIF